jgi:hypothetical protein
MKICKTRLVLKISDLEADKVETVVDPGGGQNGDDAAEAAQCRQRHSGTLFILDPLDVGRYHALQPHNTQCSTLGMQLDNIFCTLASQFDKRWRFLILVLYTDCRNSVDG